MPHKNTELRRWHIILAIATMLTTPIIAGFSSYYSSLASVRDEITRVDMKVIAGQVENERRFAKSETLDEVNTKLTQLSSDVSWIKGYLQERK